MDIKFILNEYVLAWNLLFRESISKELNDYKQKIWKNYKKQYNNLYNEGSDIVIDPDNYIPKDDTIYNVLNDIDIYKDIYNNVLKYKVALAKVYDENKKDILKEIKSILKFDIDTYSVFLIDPRLTVSTYSKEKKPNVLIYGKIIDKSFLETLIDIIYNIVKKEIGNYQEEYKEIVQAILELAILNECATRITGVSHSMKGDNSLSFLKKQIYPYFLMYLGVNKENMSNYMMRDGIAFNINDYEYDKSFNKMNLFSFIDYCIINQKAILKINQIEL